MVMENTFCFLKWKIVIDNIQMVFMLVPGEGHSILFHIFKLYHFSFQDALDFQNLS